MVKVNGPQEKLSILEITHRGWKKVMANCISQVVTFIKVISLKIKEKDTERCFGQMVHSTKEIGKEEYRMEKDKFT